MWKAIRLFLISIMLSTGICMAADEPKAGDMVLGGNYGWRSVSSSFSEADRNVQFGGFFRGWATDRISVFARASSLREDFDLSGNLGISVHVGPVYFPIQASYYQPEDTAAFGGGVGIGFQAGSKLRLEFEWTGNYLEDSDLAEDWNYEFWTGVGWVF